MKYELKLGDNAETLKQYPDNYFDSIVTDPPYGIEFLGKDWDKNTGVMETWNECFRVLKPGGHILAFSAARTYHNLATNIELAGFEIRDQLMWLYGSGFPKAQDIGKAIERREGKRATGTGFKQEAYTGILEESSNRDREGGIGSCNQCGKNNMAIPKNYNKCEEEPCFMREQAKPVDNEWAVWKTALKPAHEPIVMARKPFKGSCIDNILKHGTGAMNIDATRVESEPRMVLTRKEGHNATLTFDGTKESEHKDTSDVYEMKEHTGRYPSNVLGEIPEYQNYFYSPKVSRAERHIGFEEDNIAGIGSNNGDAMGMLYGDKNSKLRKVMGEKKNLDHIQTFSRDKTDGESSVQILRKRDEKNLDHIVKRKKGIVNETGGESAGYQGLHKLAKTKEETQSLGNNHPTVKPVELMKYLIKLVTPAGGKVLDPFNGSGSTGMACVELEYEYTGCELDPEYIEIATKRIEGWYEHTRPETNFNELFDE